MKKILYLVTEASYFCSHRLELATFIKEQGYIVGVATRCSNVKYKNMILEQGLQLFELKNFNRVSFVNPFHEFRSLKEIYNIYNNFQPDLVHHVALKPIIYGTLIAKLLKVKKVVNALPGLGFVFTEFEYKFYKGSIVNYYKKILIKFKQKILQIIIYRILKIILILKEQILLLQNKDDLELLKKTVGLNSIKVKISIIPGSGISMHKYYRSLPLTKDHFNDRIKIVLLSRLLWTKGVYEFVAAAQQVKNYIQTNDININTDFILYGVPDLKNPASISYSDLKTWESQKLIIWKKFCNDVISAYQDAHIVVLPSYREGLPKSLLEAAACARAIVTTDVPGCREIVSEGVNGYLVPKGNIELLTANLLRLITNRELMINMGKLGRDLILKKFSAQIIFPQTLAMYLS